MTHCTTLNGASKLPSESHEIRMVTRIDKSVQHRQLFTVSVLYKISIVAPKCKRHFLVENISDGQFSLFEY